MPELPEVEIVRRGLEPALKDKSIDSITLNRMDLRVPIPSNFKECVEGSVAQSIMRRGKYILVFFDNQHGFVLHLGMSGRVNIYGPRDEYTPAKHDHVVFHMADKTRIVFNDPRRFGMLYLTSEAKWQEEKPFSEMGPEPLGNNFSGEALYERLNKRRTSIKSALLNQHIVSGVGNIYACEALFEANIDPHRLACDVPRAECDLLAQAIRGVLERAIAAGGSSLKDYAHTDGSLGYFQHGFKVYDREGTPCPECDCDIIKTSGIKRVVQSGRSTFFCSQKQI